MAQQGILSLSIKDRPSLYSAYMPFVQGGGLFVQSTKRFGLGDEVFLLLNLMDLEERLPIPGKVIWITPKGAQGKRTAGIGVQFSELDKGQTKNKVENYLAAALKSERQTHTM